MIGEIFFGVVIVVVCAALVRQQVQIILYNMRVRRRFRRMIKR